MHGVALQSAHCAADNVGVVQQLVDSRDILKAETHKACQPIVKHWPNGITPSSS
jgi:hypothetical protein